ncbi:MAG TPA: secondary thiamine-phosphate synthase enzyme YjbQ [Candidatus Krumholzibacterium sp.]|nr:secondary thiamine-phosphate synthase enzyme YjbQ [Candidatus Krumholzibacterium sp.]
MTYEKEFRFESGGNGTVIDITGYLDEALAESGILTGQLVVVVPGSTAAITTIEYEPGLLRDLPELLERLIPSNVGYGHDATWGDGNGFSHLRSSLIGTSFSVPVSSGQMVLGTWQQVVFLDFDNRSRSRRIHVNITGGQEHA